MEGPMRPMLNIDFRQQPMTISSRAHAYAYGGSLVQDMGYVTIRQQIL